MRSHSLALLSRVKRKESFSLLSASASLMISPTYLCKYWGKNQSSESPSQHFQSLFIQSIYKSLSSLADEGSLRNVLHGPHSPSHLLRPEQLETDSETIRLLSHPAAARVEKHKQNHGCDVFHGIFKWGKKKTGGRT